MRFSRHAFLIVTLTLLIAIMAPAGVFVAAQDDADRVEQAALAAHLQNRRGHGYTAWIGGPLGDAEQAPAITALGDTLDAWSFSGQAGDDDLAFGDITRPTLLNFWASWCHPCRLEFPYVAEAALAPDAHAFDVVLVNIWDDPADAEAYLNNFPADLRTVLDDGDQFSRLASVASIPTSMLIDTDGTVLVVHTGLLTPTILTFLDEVAAQPGVGSFVAADYADVEPHAILTPVNADEAEPVAFDTPMNGKITADNPQDAYRFEAQAGDDITITQSAADSELDSYLVLLDADGTIIAENDDITPGLVQNSFINLLVPADGTYIVVATRFLEQEGFSEGAYELRVENTTMAAAGEVAEPSGSVGEVAAAIPAEAVTLAYGQTVTGTISNQTYEETWTFYGTEGDPISAIMTRAADVAGGLDGLLILRGPDNDVLLEVDDAGSSVMPAIEDYTLPQTGVYTLVATRFGGEGGFSIGEYALELQGPGSATSPAAPDTTPAGVETTLAYGQTVTGMISSQTYEDTWTFYGTEGDTITAIMTRAEDVSGGLDGYLILRGPDGSVLLEVDDANNGIMPAIEDYTLPQTGVYTLVATRFGGESGYSVGEYAVELQGQTATADSPPPVETDLTYGASVTDTISDAAYEHMWTFYGTEGDTISAIMTATDETPGGLDGYLLLRGPDDDVLLEVDDASGSIMPAIESYTLPQTGVYTLVATRFGFANGFSRGEYTLELRLDSSSAAAPGSEPGTGQVATTVRWFDPGALPGDLRWIGYNGPVEGTLNAENVGDWYIFNGTAGDEIAIMMTSGTSDLDPFVLLVDENGVELARNDDAAPGAPDAIITGFTLPADGSYLIRATRYGMDYGPSEGDYSLVIETDASSPAVDDSALVPVDLPLGTTVSGALDLNAARTRYTFEAAAGDTLTATVMRTAGDLDPALTLYDADGTQLTGSHQWQSSDEARISRFELPATGTYHLDVRLDNLSTAGEYALFAVLSDPLVPDAGAFIPTAEQDLEVVLIWDAAVDLDLAAAGPADATTDAAHANDFCADTVSTPVEQLTWAEGSAVPGTYTITVDYRLDCTGSAATVDFILVIVQRGEVIDIIGGTIARAGDRYSTSVIFE